VPAGEELAAAKTEIARLSGELASLKARGLVEQVQKQPPDRGNPWVRYWIAQAEWISSLSLLDVVFAASFSVSLYSVVIAIAGLYEVSSVTSIVSLVCIAIILTSIVSYKTYTNKRVRDKLAFVALAIFISPQLLIVITFGSSCYFLNSLRYSLGPISVIAIISTILLGFLIWWRQRADKRRRATETGS
jgi:hypothetical protein